MEQRPDDTGCRSDGTGLNDHIDPEISKRQVMKRRRSAALAGAAVLFMTVALAVNPRRKGEVVAKCLSKARLPLREH